MTSPRTRSCVALAGVAIIFVTLGAATANADRVRLDVELSTPVMLERTVQTAYLKIGLTGFEIQEGDTRTPVNVAIVLDRSGSMSGQKMRKAKEAAIMAVDRLGPDDIVSIVAYNHTVKVLIPATKVRNRSEIYRQIHSLISS